MPRRIGIGILLVTLGLLATGLLEKMRKDTLENGEFTQKEIGLSPELVDYTVNNKAAFVKFENISQLVVVGVLKQYNVSQSNEGNPVSQNNPMGSEGDDSVGVGGDSSSVPGGGNTSDPIVDITTGPGTQGLDANDTSIGTAGTGGSGDIPGKLATIDMDALLRNKTTEFQQLMVSAFPKLTGEMNNLSLEAQVSVQSKLPLLVDILADMPLDNATSILNILPELLKGIANISPQFQKPVFEKLFPLLPRLLDIPPASTALLIDELSEIPPQILPLFLGMTPETLFELMNVEPQVLKSSLGMLPLLSAQLKDIPEQKLKPLIGMLGQMLPQLLPQMGKVPSATLPRLIGILPKVLLQLEDVPPEKVQTLMKNLPEMLPDVLPLLGDGTTATPKALQEMMPQVLLNIMIGLPPGQAQALLKKLQQMLPIMRPLLESGGESDALKPLMEKLPQVLLPLANLPIEKVKALITMLRQTMSKSEANGIPSQLSVVLIDRMIQLIPILAYSSVEEFQKTTATITASAFGAASAHLISNTPDGFPLWHVRKALLAVSNMSIFTQIPQFMLVGIGEALAAVAGLQLAYYQAPFAFQGLTTGFHVMAMGTGSLVSSYLVVLVGDLTEACNPLGLCSGTWFSPTTGDVNTQNMHYMMFLVGGVAGAAFLLYLLVTSVLYRPTDPITFTELEDSELPGIEMKGATSEEPGNRTNGTSVAY